MTSNRYNQILKLNLSKTRTHNGTSDKNGEITKTILY